MPRLVKVVAAVYWRLLNSPATFVWIDQTRVAGFKRTTFTTIAMRLRYLPFLFAIAVFPLLYLSAENWVWPDGTGITYKPEVSEDGSTYQLRFMTTPGVNYTIESSEDLQTWTPDITYRGIGHTIIHPLLALPQHDGSPPVAGSGEPAEPIVPASLRITKILASADPSAAQTGLLVNWPSLDDEQPKSYTLYGQTLEDDAPPLYAGEFQPYTYFIQFLGEITDPSTVPPSDSLGPKDAAMISNLLDSLPTINAEIAASTASASAAPTAPPATGGKRFHRIRRTYVDSDNDGIQDHLEDQQGTNMWNWDTDGDGISDGQDQNPLVNDAVADPDGAGLPATLANGLTGRWDLESLASGSYPNSADATKPATIGGAVATDQNGIISRAAACSADGDWLRADPRLFSASNGNAVSLWFRLEKDSIQGKAIGVRTTIWSYNRGLDNSITETLSTYKALTPTDRQKIILGSANFTAYVPHGKYIDDARWHHLVYSHDGNDAAIWLDGEKIGEAGVQEGVIDRLSWNAATNDWLADRGWFLFGNDYPVGAQTGPDTNIRGSLDRLRTYNRSLTNAEIQALHKQDADRDGLWDTTESKSLLWRDTNGDGIRTADESHYTINPFRHDPPNSDHDGDGLSSLAEQNTHGTEISNPDTDGDLTPDGWETDNGLDPLDPSDGLLDNDNDGVTNLDEYRYNTDPNGTGGINSDSDGDGKSDAEEIAQGSHPGDARDGGQPIPEPERLSIKLGIGDKSGSESEDYVLHVYRIDPDTGQEKRHYTLRSGGHGEYKEETKNIFWENDTYTFQIDWQSSNLSSSSDPNNPEGADYDYHFIVEPQNDDKGVLVDQYDPEIRRVDLGQPITGIKSDVDTFQQTVESKRVARVHADFLTDLNNDGVIDFKDKTLRDDAEKTGATSISKQVGTEYLFVNDNLSNGLDDKEDSLVAPGTIEDDDTEAIQMSIPSKFGIIRFDHPAIDKLKFYESKKCVKLVQFPFDLGGAKELPKILYVRAEGDFDGQITGMLTLKYSVTSEFAETVLSSTQLVIVNQFGDSDYFYASRDYILEKNTRFHVRDRVYEDDRFGYTNSQFRIVSMRESATTMFPVDSSRRPNGGSLKGIDSTVAAFPGISVAINGNITFFADDRNAILAGLQQEITDQCHGRMVRFSTWDLSVSSDNDMLTTSPKGSGLAGPDGKYVLVDQQNKFVFGKGRVPVNPIPKTALGGGSTNYANPEREGKPYQVIGRCSLENIGGDHVMLFTATHRQPVGNGKVGKIAELVSDAKTSKVAALPDGNAANDIELLLLDGGSSVALGYTNTQDNMNIHIKAGKHLGPPFYYINTYLLFRCEKDR